MKLKKKRKWVWCNQKETNLHECAWSHYGSSHKYGTNLRQFSKTFSEARRKAAKTMKIPKHIRCPECNRRFRPRIRECHDHGCFHAYLPPHKRYE